ncbi:MAG: hypothetical protein J6A59_12610 [Lachnospiraceae bacterium]|nr:hypothetical protein [Lachnospiraceae bacterium]
MSNTNIFKTLLEIGNDLASLWGGYCKGAEINTDENRVEFLCSEHGEEFLTSLTFDEIEEEYDIKIA